MEGRKEKYSKPAKLKEVSLLLDGAWI